MWASASDALRSVTPALTQLRVHTKANVAASLGC
jgi:hypothetical protein